MDNHPQTWILCNIPPDQLVPLSVPERQNSAPIKKRRRKGKRFMTTKKKRTPQGLALWKQHKARLKYLKSHPLPPIIPEDLSGIPLNGKRWRPILPAPSPGACGLGTDSPNVMLQKKSEGPNGFTAKRIEHWGLVLPSPSQGTCQTNTASPNFAYLYPVQLDNLTEPSSILPDNTCDQPTSPANIRSNSLDGESSVLSSQSFHIDPKGEMIEETSPDTELRLHVSPCQNGTFPPIMSAAAPIHPITPSQDGSIITIAPSQAKLIVSPTQSDSTLPPTSSEAESIFPITPHEGETILPMSPSEAESIFPYTPHKDETILPMSPSEAESIFPYTPHKDETILPMSPSEAESILPMSPSEAESILPMSPSEAESIFPITPHESETILPITSSEAESILPITPSEAESVLPIISSEFEIPPQVTILKTESILEETVTEPSFVIMETTLQDKVAIRKASLVPALATEEILPEVRMAFQKTPPEARIDFQETPPEPSLPLEETSLQAAPAFKGIPKSIRAKGSSKIKVNHKPTPHRNTVDLQQNSLGHAAHQESSKRKRSLSKLKLASVKDSPSGLVDVVVLELKQRLPFPWLVLPDEDGIHVLLISRLPEKAIQRRAFFAFVGREDITVHRKPIPTFISKIILNDTVCDAVALTGDRKEAFVSRVLIVIDRFRSYEICTGVSEPELKHLWGAEKNGEVDKNWYGELRYTETFRPSDCEILVPTMPMLRRCCSVCTLKNVWLKGKSEKMRESDMDSVHVPTSNLDSKRLLNQVKTLQMELKQARSQVVMLLKESEDMNDANKFL